MNTLNTILDQDGARAEVQKWLVDRWMARETYEAGLAHTQYADELMLPENKGQCLEVSRQMEPRRPQKLQSSNPTADPASGQKLEEAKLVVPIEFIQDYVGIGLVAGLTSRHDLRTWADGDLVRAYQKRAHELVQNCFKVGRMQPGVWAADGTESTAFDAAAEATVTMWGQSFTFDAANASFAGGKGNIQELQPGDRVSLGDFEREGARLKLKRAPRIKGKYVSWISESTKLELMKDELFLKAMLAFKESRALAENQIADFKGFHWMEDDMPFCEQFGNEGVRVEYGPLHTSICFGAHAFAFLKLGSKSKLKPTFKVQDTTITGVLKTIGYTIPFQVAMERAAWGGTITGPVTHWDPDNM